MPSIEQHPLVVVVGPTGVGKTECSLFLAEQLNGEIVSADSRLFYRGMDVGTAKPSKADLQRIPHHLIDVCDLNETWSLGRFQQEAQEAIDDILSRGKQPFLVGGTGQYVQAIVEGWVPPSVEPNERLRLVLTQYASEVGRDALHRKLSMLDRAAAENIDPRNVRRTIRALEVIFSTGRRFSDLRRRDDPLYPSIIIGLTRPRAVLYQRIDDRIDQMISSGLVDEVRWLLSQGISRDFPAMSAIGYREIVSYLHGEISFEAAVAEMKKRTRQFVRRQANWFKLNDPNIFWFDLETYSNNQICSFLRERISRE